MDSDPKAPAQPDDEFPVWTYLAALPVILALAVWDYTAHPHGLTWHFWHMFYDPLSRIFGQHSGN